MPSASRDRRYKNQLLLILALVLAFNYVDRTVLGLTLQSIKADFSLSDTQLGFLTGISFALFYSVMGVPIARWADRGDRTRIIALTTVLWTIATILSGLTRTFWQLVLVRVCTAVGEAGCIPPAHSLIAETFSRPERARAVSRYMLGAPLSGLFGYYLGGWLNELYGWRATFILLGLPGLVVAGLVVLVLREPRRQRTATAPAPDTGSTQAPAVPASPPPEFKQVCATLWRNRAFRHLLLCVSINYFFGYGLNFWQPAFFVRSYGLHTGELGTWFTLIFSVGGAIGTWFGGEWASSRARNNEQKQLNRTAVAYAGFGVISSLTYLAPNQYWAFALLAVGALGVTTAAGPMFSVIQTVVPENMRAVAVALIYFCANLIGMGFGPLAAGALSDALYPTFHEDSLRYTLLALSPGYLWCAWHLWRAARLVPNYVSSTPDSDKADNELQFEQSTVRRADAKRYS